MLGGGKFDERIFESYLRAVDSLGGRIQPVDKRHCRRHGYGRIGRLNPEPIFGGETTTFAGISAADVNVQRDGITVNDTRYPVGISSTTRINPDLVGEVRMVLTPVDAELGRGNGQVQILTRSGTND